MYKLFNIIFYKIFYIMINSKISIKAFVIDSQISKKSAIAKLSRIYHSKIEKYSYIGKNSTVQYTSIGKFCSIGENVFIGLAKHPSDWVSTSPLFYSGRNILKKKIGSNDYFYDKTVVIGNDVWIGNNVMIMSGVKIGDGVIIGSGAIVTRDIPSYSIVAGVPAKLLKMRFDNSIIDKLLNIKWWDFDEKYIVKLGDYVNDIDEFIRKAMILNENRTH